jgi:hypothetical protein
MVQFLFLTNDFSLLSNVVDRNGNKKGIVAHYNPLVIWEICQNTGELGLEHPLPMMGLGNREERLVFYNHFQDILKAYVLEYYETSPDLKTILNNIDQDQPLIPHGTIRIGKK